MIPVALAVYYGSAYIERILDAIPVWLMNGLTVAGGMLPALGFAIVVTVIGQRYLPVLCRRIFHTAIYGDRNFAAGNLWRNHRISVQPYFTNSKKAEGGTINGTPG